MHASALNRTAEIEEHVAILVFPCELRCCFVGTLQVQRIAPKSWMKLLAAAL
jgi:hypothetical protein